MTKTVWNLYGNSSFQKRYNIAPSQEVPVIIRKEGHNEAKLMKWGLVPSWVYTFTIITSHANALVRRIHHRMPVMYRRDMGKQWLEQSVSDDLVLSLITQPVLLEEIEAYEVSTLVNSPENDSPECVRRVRQQTRDAQLSLGHRS